MSDMTERSVRGIVHCQCLDIAPGISSPESSVVTAIATPDSAAEVGGVGNEDVGGDALPVPEATTIGANVEVPGGMGIGIAGGLVGRLMLAGTDGDAVGDETDVAGDLVPRLGGTGPTVKPMVPSVPVADSCRSAARSTTTR